MKLYYPAFKESSIYLRFLNELLHTLNKEDELAQAAPASLSSDSPENAPVNSTGDVTAQSRVLSFAAHILERDLDDPNSLYDRPCLS